MPCPLCGASKARRACPALGQSICPRCCGTKRLVEIRCPADCAHLAAAREHPAAEVRRRQEADVARLLPSMQGLSERQQQVYFLYISTVLAHVPDELAPLRDEDVAEAAGACAATLETAERGVIYDHEPAAPPARRLAGELKAKLVEAREHTRIYDHEAARALRAIERGARDTARPDEGPRTWLELVARLLEASAPAPGAGAGGGPSIVVP